jgi:predicted ArsR family transcriptional regulator
LFTIVYGTEVADTAWDQRFFSSTRGKIVLLLRDAPATVEQLANNLELTDNAVRAHLAVLERDGLVEQSGTVRTARRPSLRYTLGPAADRLFPKAYGRVLNAVLAVFGRALPRKDMERALRTAGRELADGPAHSRGRSLSSRLVTAVEIVRSLGGTVSVEHNGAATHLIGRSCPLAQVVPEHPEVCGLVETLLSEATGLQMEEECDRSGTPHCHFIIRASASQSEA